MVREESVVLPKKEHSNWLSNTISENTHITIHTEHVIIVIRIDENNGMDLKDLWEMYMGKYRGEKGKREIWNYFIISKKKKRVPWFD